VPTPAWVTLPEAGRRAADLRLVRAAGLAYPLMLKPAREDASVGISAASVVEDDEALCAQLAVLRAQHRQPMLCEEYVPGRELYVSLLGNDPAQALPLTEIDFSHLPKGQPRIVCYDAKWTPGTAAYAGTRSGPAGPLSPEVTGRIVAAAQAAAAALGLRDYGRCDVRLGEDGTPYVIDVNPNCDLSDGAGFSLAARQGGLPYDALVERIAAAALHRSEHAGRRAQPLPDPAAAGARADGAPRARVDGRPVLAGRGELRPRADRQRAV
jgi:D-alanine-D-alanine ligase